MRVEKLLSYFLKDRMQYLRKSQKNLTTTTIVQPFQLVGCGNPLLDIIAKVDTSYLEKYGLKPNRAYLAEQKHLPLYRELMKDYQVEFTAGGAVQNTLRVCQWILQKPYTSVFVGCVGTDEFSRILRERASKDGVHTEYQAKDCAPTGTCAVLVTGTERTLVANLAAAQSFTIDHLYHPLREAIIENARYFYISGFFLTVCLPCILQIAKNAAKRNNVFIFNLSATYVSHRFMASLKAVLPYVDILFGNDDEMLAFSRDNGWNTKNHEEIGRKIQDLPKMNQLRSRVVIITQGPKNVLVFQENSVKEFEVPFMADKDIVDTNGAGDAFVGGFLSQYLQGKSLNVCVECGIYAAQHILLQSGCTFRGKPSFKEPP